MNIADDIFPIAVRVLVGMVKLASPYPEMVRLPGCFLKVMPNSIEPFRYCRTQMAFLSCDVVGACRYRHGRVTASVISRRVRTLTNRREQTSERYST